MTVIHIILMAAQYLYNNDVTYLRNNVSQHSIGSTPHNNGTYFVRRDVDTRVSATQIKP